MAIQGLRDTSGFVTDQRPKNWREAIMLLYPNGKAPLTAMTSMMKSRKVDDPEFNWWTKSLPDQRVQLATGQTITATTTTLTLATGGLALKDGHLLKFEENSEIVAVNGDPTSNTSITVTRGAAGTTATTITATGAGVNPYLVVVGNANEEGSDAPTGISYDPTKVYNYAQIFRNTLEMTRTASRTRLRTGDSVKEAKRECLELHSMEMEKAFWLGERSEGTKNGKPWRTTRGIANWIDSNNIISALGTTITMTTLEGYLEQAFRYGSEEKVGFCGNIAMLTLQRIARLNSSYQLMQGQKEFGMNVSRLICPFGTVILKTHPLFNQLTGGTTGTGTYYGMNSWLFILDMAEISYTYIDDTKYEKDLQANGQDGMKSGYLTEAGLEFHHPTAHFLIKGLATAGTG